MESNSGMANNNVMPTPAAPVKKKNTSLKLGKILMIVGGCGIALYILIVLGFTRFIMRTMDLATVLRVRVWLWRDVMDNSVVTYTIDWSYGLDCRYHSLP